MTVPAAPARPAEDERLAAPAAERLWTRDQVAQFRAALSGSAAHAIDTSQLTRRLNTAQSAGSPDEDLSGIALAYASILAKGVVDPHDLHQIYTLETPRPDLEPALKSALEHHRLGAWLDTLPPQDPQYRALSRAYLALRIAPRLADIPAGSAIRPGALDPRVPVIARRLRLLGFDASASGDRYDARLASVVRAFQTSAALSADGVIGDRTLEALNRGPQDQARLLALNMERLRWLARDPAPLRIDVNLADASLTYFDDGAPAWSGKVIAGRPSRKTPLLQASFDSIVVNPPWHVPASIARTEILPRGPEYLAAHNMTVKDGRVTQRPGPQSALGVVKFDLQDPYAIYLHDTPSKSLFGRARRFLSHGCVRVENAVQLAKVLTAKSGREPALDRALESDATAVVRLDAPVDVRLMYLTAFVGADGRIDYRPDVYGWDAELASAMGVSEPADDGAPEPALEDLGP